MAARVRATAATTETVTLGIFSLGTRSTLIDGTSRPVTRDFAYPAYSPRSIVVSAFTALSRPIKTSRAKLYSTFFPLRLLSNSSFSHASTITLTRNRRSSWAAAPFLLAAYVLESSSAGLSITAMHDSPTIRLPFSSCSITDFSTTRFTVSAVLRHIWSRGAIPRAARAAPADAGAIVDSIETGTDTVHRK